VPAPGEVSQRENILLSPPYLMGPRVFSTFTESKLTETHLEMLFRVYGARGRYMLVFPAGKGEPRKARILLHKDATDSDVLRALLAFHQARLRFGESGAWDNQEAVLEDVERWVDEAMPGFLRSLEAAGWHNNKFMYGAIRRRVRW